MKFPGLIFAQYKSINIILYITIIFFTLKYYWFLHDVNKMQTIDPKDFTFMMY